MKKYLFILPIFILLFYACDKEDNYGSANIIPRPDYYLVSEDVISLNSKVKIVLQEDNEILRNSGDLLAEMLRELTGFEIPIVLYDEAREVNRDIVLSTHSTKQMEKHSYEIMTRMGTVMMQAQDAEGMFYAIQSFLQLLPPELLAGKMKGEIKKINLPRMHIVDKPRFEYRGMHLDVSRHFFPKEFILKFIDLMAFYKFNTFHWHLTDDNGWRLEIDQYPLLTEISAWRADHEDEPWRGRSQQRPGEEATYGGFYTKDDVREVLAYAKERFITVIPEIEMPGHTSEVFAAYPELSCSGEKLTVQTGGYWPNKDIFCAGKEETFEFIENVLDEVIELFPSQYIHIGGDEAFKEAWEECPLCQNRISEEGLKDEHELQSYFIKRIEKYLISKGKKMIGWDEILEGGLAPEATVMSWRGMQGGIEAAQQGHDVIITPTSHCYFDYYQADPEFEPEAIGGFTTLKKVYSFEPIPDVLSEEEAKHVLGAQGNIWTEWIATPDHAEYMSIPRMLALAEVVWTDPEKKSWRQFNKRLQQHFRYFDLIGVNYAKGSYAINFETEIDTSGYKLSLITEQYKKNIHYTIDGSEPDTNSMVYKHPISVDADMIIKAAIFEDGKLMEKVSTQEVKLHKGVGARINFDKEFTSPYNDGVNTKLLDGLKGSFYHRDGKWLGVKENSLEAIIDLGSSKKIDEISASFYQRYASWIFLPETITYYISNDGIDFIKLGRIGHNRSINDKEEIKHHFDIELLGGEKTRYIKLFIQGIGMCPEGHPGEGEKSWLFIDEIEIK